MPHRDLMYDVELPISYKLQYLLSLIPVLGLFVSCITCIINLKKLNRTTILSWLKLSLIPILILCIVCPLCIYLITTEDDSVVVFAVSTALLSYLSLVGIAFGMVWAELKVIGKWRMIVAKDKLIEKQKDE